MSKQNNSYLTNLTEWYNTLENDNLLLLFKGEFTQEFVKAIISLTEQRLGIKKESSTFSTKMMVIIIESLQNICKHAVKEKGDLGWAQGIFLIGKANEEHIISTGNYILNSNVKPLEMMLSNINSLNKVAKNEMYREKLIKAELSEKGGAGLGLITMAKKSNENLEYSFKKVNDRFSFFTLEVKVAI